MKKEISFLLTVIMLAAILTCAYTDGKKMQEGGIETPVESAAGKTEAETEAVETKPSAAAKEAETETEAAEMKPSAAAEKTEAETLVRPDLNHNGVAEEIRLTETENRHGQRLEIWENGELLDVSEGYYTHGGQNSVFLCTLEGEDYLLRYHPTMYQGVGTYDYKLLMLENGGETLVRWNNVDFDINFGAPVHTCFDSEAVAAFMEEINDLLSHSVSLLNTDTELLCTFEKEGKLYDSLWWLDNWEPEFIRNKNKSLPENLKDFQVVMTAAQKPVVLEELDNLPITEPVQMAFFSGAGAWATYLVIDPDGSFLGHYHDSDGSTVYICPFYGKFGKVEKLTDASFLLTLEELELDTGRDVGEEWDETDEYGTIHYISSEPYGFCDMEGTALKPGAQFILYSPEAKGHEPGTELYGAMEFQSWVHERKDFESDADCLDCWGLQNRETGQGFYEYHFL